jgi:hypothetical protein
LLVVFSLEIFYPFAFQRTLGEGFGHAAGISVIPPATEVNILIGIYAGYGFFTSGEKQQASK